MYEINLELRLTHHIPNIIESFPPIWFTLLQILNILNFVTLVKFVLHISILAEGISIKLSENTSISIMLFGSKYYEYRYVLPHSTNMMNKAICVS